MQHARILSLVLSAGLLACGASESDDNNNTNTSRGGSGGSSPTPSAGSGGSKAGSGGSGGSTAAGAGGSAMGGAGGSTGGSPGAGGTGGAMGGAGGGVGDASPDTPDAQGDAGATEAGPSAPGAYGPCPNCKPLFDGKNLDNWIQGAEGAWIIKEGALASTGKSNDIWTKEDYRNYRIFFSVRQIRGNHQPGVLFFGDRAGNKPRRGLSGIQVQPPNGYTWDYRPGKNNSGGAYFTKLPHPKLDVKKWSQCEVLVKDTGELRVACCQLPDGGGTCKGVEQLRFKDTAAAGKNSPFGIQMHNGGLFDEYKDIYIETDPAVDDLLSIQ